MEYHNITMSMIWAITWDIHGILKLDINEEQKRLFYVMTRHLLDIYIYICIDYVMYVYIYIYIVCECVL